MKLKLAIIITMLLITHQSVSLADINITDTAAKGVEKLIFTDWLKKKALKQGYSLTFQAYQTLNGMTEGYRFRQSDTHGINSSNYHAYATAQRTMGMASGWMGYALYQDKKFYSWKQKLMIVTGSALRGRNRFEWAYKGVRYGNPLDYTVEHNECALMLFTLKNWKIVDVSIGTGPVSGPLVDLTFELAGWWLMWKAG